MKKIILFVFYIALMANLKAQDIGQIIAGSRADANKYFNSYMQPFGEGEIYNLSRGWFSTAKAHHLLGFDISVNMQTAVIPGDKQNFTFDNSDYSTFKLSGSASSASLPTFMGGTTGQQIDVTATVNGQTGTTNFTAPNGIGNDFKKNISFLPVSVPLPVAQVGIGVFKHTDIKVRYFPKTNFNNVEIGVFGVGLQHEFSDYLPFIKKAPFLHLSALAAYNKIDATYLPNLTATSKPVASTDSKINYSINSYTVQAIASVKLPIVELYTSVGYSGGKSNVDFKGNYTASYSNGSSATVSDPVSLSYAANGLSNTWGVRLNLAFFKIYADYTFAKYNGLGAGVAFSFR